MNHDHWMRFLAFDEGRAERQWHYPQGARQLDRRAHGQRARLSRQIAEAHNGWLTLANRTDRTGSEALLRLPRQGRL